MVKLVGVCLQSVARSKCGGLRNTSKGIPSTTHKHISRYEEDKGKVKKSLNRPGVAQRVPGSIGS
jgi:hypothetical protein